ncbi:MAG: outer membrane protein assembly factor BamE [Alcaligenaceae bacterium]|nr:outer membrane protein assembly factor BamE [Alcaligenaceae bacterium]
MKKFNLLLAVMTACVLVACASSGNKVLKEETAQTVSSKIHKNETTKEQVRALYGDPMNTSFTDSGNEIWRYEFVKSKADAVNFIPIVNYFGSSSSGTKKELVIFFNQKGVVKNYSMQESQFKTGTGVFQ